MVRTKIFVLLACCSTIAVTTRGIRDAPKELSAEEIKQAEETLQNTLYKLAADGGENYKISKLHTATKQVDSGALTNINVDLIAGNGAVKNFNVSYFSQPWLKNQVQVTFEWEGENKGKRRHTFNEFNKNEH